MKKSRRKWGAIFALAAIALLCALAGFLGRPARVRADETTDAAEQFEGTIDELIGALDTEELQNFLDGLSEFGGISVKEKLSQIVSGDLRLDYQTVWDAIRSLVWEEGKTLLPAFALILAASLLCGILNSAKNSFLQSTTSDIIYFVSYLSVGAVVLSVLVTVLESGYAAIASMQRQMEIVFPLLLTLMAASGGTVSAGIFRPAVAFLSGAISELFTAVVLPIAIVVIVLAFVGNLTEEVRTEKLGEFFKSISKWLLGLSLGAFSLFLTVQGLASAQYDGLSLRTAKYLISGSVPIVGGFLSGGVELVIAGSAVIKNALGTFAVLILVATVAKPLLLFALFQLLLKLGAAVTEPIGGKISAFLSALSKDSGYFLAGLLCVAFLYFITVVLLICSTGVLL